MIADEELKQAQQGDIMTVGELTYFLQLHPSLRLRRSTIYRLLRQDALPALKVGSHWGFSRKAIEHLAK